LGDEPQMDAERYVYSFLEAARQLSARRIVGLGGVYGEVPYNRERLISSIYSLARLKDELLNLAVNLSDYEGGASIGSYICRRASEQDLEYLSFYAFVPLYDFSSLGDMGNSVRIENDFTAWLGVMQRINYNLKLSIDLADLEKRSERLIQAMDKKIDAMEEAHPELGVRVYLEKLSDGYTESSFNPLDEVWEEELRRLLDKFDDEPGEDDLLDEDEFDDPEEDEF
jgi:proteasome assembly chaperone (PAC2) family protein